ncbi:MAG: hypothetical protein IKZ13_10445 [Akkermansia sp.]|nr:hypothetical protein [Akkermansia sp.]
MTIPHITTRIGLLSLGLLPAMPAVVATAPVVAEASATNLPPAVQKAINKGDYEKVQTALTEALKGSQITPDSPQILHAAMLLELIRTTGADTMTTFARELKHRHFLAKFVQDSEWLELYLSCGLVPYRTDEGLSVLYRIFMAEKMKVRNKPLAVAFASAWGGGETDPKPRALTRNPNRFNPVWRYNFFIENAAKGLLHPNFKNLRPWELRFVTGNPWQDWDDKSFEWALENINVPWDQYGNACWAATYTDPSKFGDGVQGGMYNLPYTDQSQAEACHLNGGVCGAMSHLGCVAAQAHGIPAFTVGQPGHCAYAVRTERGNWVGGFGGPDGGMHNRIFGNQAPTSYLLMETVFADDATIAKAYRHSFCARALEATGDTAAAVDMWKKTLEISPLHPFFRTALCQLMKSRGLTPQQAYDYLAKAIPMYKGNGFAAVNMTADFDKEIAAMSDEQKSSLYNLMHTMIAGTQTSWAVKCEDLIQKQSDSLSTLSGKEKFLSSALATHMNAEDPTTFGQILEWAVKTYIANGQEELFSRAFSQAAANSGGNSNDADKAKKMAEAYNKAIVAAEQARSAPAFRSLTEAAVKLAGPCPVNTTLKSSVPGKPVQAAMFRISTSCQWDTPAWHINITTPTGGKCHTGKEEQPYMVVELPQHQYVSGTVIRKTDGNEWRMKKATVYTSEDGATWKPRATTENMPKEWPVTFADGTRAKWVKVEFDNNGQADFAHISHFVIYSK